MIHRDAPLRLDGRFTHLVSRGDSILLVGEEDSLLLETPLAGDVVRRIDGHSSSVEIAEALRDLHPPALVHFVLLKMEGEGLLHAVETEEEDGPRPGRERGDGPAWAGLAWKLRKAWESRGARVGATLLLNRQDRPPVQVLLTDDYLHPELPDLRQELMPLQEACLLARVGREKVWIGPWSLPGETACITCLQERLRINLVARTILHLSLDEGWEGELEVEPLHHPVPRTAFQRMARGILEVDPSREDPTEIRVLKVAGPSAHDSGSKEEVHPVFRLPHCRVCGNPSLTPPGPHFQLQSAPGFIRSSGGWRKAEPAETLRRLEPLVSPLTGVIRHVRKVPVEAADTVHVYTANHAHCWQAGGFRTLRADRRDHSGGKGLTDLEARVSAVCESVERFSSVYRGSEPVRLGRLSEMEADSVHPNDLLHFSRDQLRNRESWNSEAGKGFQWVPEPYGDEPMEWSPARSLVSGAIRLVPSAAVYLGFTGEGRRFCPGDSNGLASGNCLEEAILQGFLELAERDSVALWWYNRARRPAVDLDSFPDARVQDTRKLYPSLGRELWVLDLTSDLEIPAFAALSAVRGGKRPDIIFGFGAHLDADIALLRSLSELNQMLPTVQRSMEERRRQLLPAFPDAIRWWETATLEGHPHLLPSRDLTPTVRQDMTRPMHEDLLSAVEECTTRAAAVGCDVLVHELTRPDVGFPVARVMVPGLRHFWRRLGPGRLYDVPVDLGWVDAPVPESRMNPVSLFV